MPPDLNSLPPPRSMSSSPLQIRTMQSSPEDSGTQSPPPRSSSVSLQAAAAINAADISRRSSTRSPQANRAAERRRSAVAMNLNFNDPTVPGPGELSNADHRSSLRSTRSSFTHSPTGIGSSPIISTGDPHHHRTPSLGEIHQELEQEQEAQVNRLLLMIRNQQAQLQQMQQMHPAAAGTTAVDDSTPASERSISFPSFPPLPPAASGLNRRSSLQFSGNTRSRRGSISATSPVAHPTGSQSEYGLSGPDWIALGGDGSGRRCSRDESAFYQAETANLTRENQMLRLRIRDLERQICELTASPAHMPVAPSNLMSSTSAESSAPTPSASESEPPLASGTTDKDSGKD
ncbi:hypothetical protein LOZ53_000294 [Ophidiomyces ophidiicola]|uniref:Uncharacterized protein n=1 Tax=Ophidiomyces ophidiicola TaxID=1387563 RepID=A0ACB8UWL5_9EURO|nr:uncharacterized protein LOZ57_002846 [Ophidiomyces ophidiicola]KAI1914368.1 hypothetical protein LOZ61_002271 [Ophidiomyces ophidiicola]KAI1927009.1 hypothetical protein LOZ64_000143 [Ophidiomyces ophidiicola]KAI1929180.1 hypothetical protein LOZ60_001832 [Ophidiomyces ophidiicola]KAI1948491.1 hypothetical protein LOZ57_002846 [Ophidiomyces ophidiicola]KAI1953137.1 hypothetical protein LOZ62_001201 [Ophidiomyces ophidiicola]